jgi:hypothetical protein
MTITEWLNKTQKGNWVYNRRFDQWDCDDGRYVCAVYPERYMIYDGGVRYVLYDGGVPHELYPPGRNPLPLPKKVI